MAILAQPATESGVEPLTLRLGSALSLSDDQLLELCCLNKELRIERTSEGDLEIMAPAGGGAAVRNSDILFQLASWAKENRTGIAFSSSAGFLLPSGAMRAPDAAWVRRSRLTGPSREEREKFLPLCPDFVVEVRLATDYLDAQREKLQEYMDSGAALGWLIDPLEKTVHVYRPGGDPEILEEPQSVSADPVLPGFELQLEEIWNPLW
jgi:Uma2 family endonuclease